MRALAASASPRAMMDAMNADERPSLLDRLSLSAIPPDAALRGSPQDAAALLVLRALRRSFIPLFALGLIGAWSTGDYSASGFAALSSPEEWFSALLSPLAGFALAVLVRVGVSGLALLLALPQVPGSGVGLGRRRWRAWVDRLQVAKAYRSLRWTWAVRAAAIDRLGTRGRRLAVAEPLTRVVGVVLLLVWFGLIYADAPATP